VISSLKGFQQKYCMRFSPLACVLHAQSTSYSSICFFLTGFYSPYLRTLAFLNGLLDPQTFGRTPWLEDQSNSRPLPTHRTTQHRNTQTHIHAPSRIRTCDLNVDSTCLRPLPQFVYPNNILWRVQVMKLLIVQSSPASCHFLPLMSKFYHIIRGMYRN
jgi:hypothetical protein